MFFWMWAKEKRLTQTRRSYRRTWRIRVIVEVVTVDVSRRDECMRCGKWNAGVTLPAWKSNVTTFHQWKCVSNLNETDKYFKSVTFSWNDLLLRISVLQNLQQRKMRRKKTSRDWKLVRKSNSTMQISSSLKELHSKSECTKHQSEKLASFIHVGNGSAHDQGIPGGLDLGTDSWASDENTTGHLASLQ